eukprot:CAMPEP_0119301350 /NCGR_PEP_ID=MMETSP1333-20130426/3150_1 /TAXON_ID=418940 /ORGANISM="Scyphosphaera apsteinii, Strain RCC1455" /LENGTH=209 /DNA_ID=CAMNT_0007303405 /DNA_START=631 /DNA_END=1260 /DNA_ORIENTATION=+
MLDASKLIAPGITVGVSRATTEALLQRYINMSGWEDLGITAKIGRSHNMRMPPHDANHMLPMSGIFARGWRVSGIGRLDTIQQDWPRILHESGFITHEDFNASFDSNAGLHESSADPLRARATLIALLQEQPDLLRKLCHRLAYDYHCFEYKLHDCISGKELRSYKRGYSSTQIDQNGWRLIAPKASNILSQHAKAPKEANWDAAWSGH